jgi:hypothetical protein
MRSRSRPHRGHWIVGQAVDPAPPSLPKNFPLLVGSLIPKIAVIDFTHTSLGVRSDGDPDLLMNAPKPRHTSRCGGAHGRGSAGPGPVVESMTSADVELYLMHIHIPQEIPRLLKKLEPYDRRVLKSLLRWYASNPTKTWHGAESAVARTLKVHRNTASRHLQIALLHFQELINNDVDLNKIRESCHTKPNSLEVDHD